MKRSQKVYCLIWRMGGMSTLVYVGGQQFSLNCGDAHEFQTSEAARIVAKIIMDDFGIQLDRVCVPSCKPLDEAVAA